MEKFCILRSRSCLLHTGDAQGGRRKGRQEWSCSPGGNFWGLMADVQQQENTEAFPGKQTSPGIGPVLAATKFFVF